MNLKELTELHNRINILSSHAATNGESDIARAEAENRYSRQDSSEEQKFYNRFALHKERTNENTTLSDRRVDKEGTVTKIVDTRDNKEETAITELYSHNLRFVRENRVI